jgi:predicted nucleic acid-binding protein
VTQHPALDLVVLDASAVVALVASGGEAGDRIAERCASATLIAPALLPVEVDSALRGLRLGKKVTDAEASAARAAFAQLPIELWPWAAVADRAWALSYNASIYDAGYLALAELTRAALLTRDARIANVPKCTARVEVV